MTLNYARLWLIKISLAITGFNFAFFIIAPAANYPLTFEQTLRLLEIIVPVFLGYLGSATYFLFTRGTPDTEVAFQGSKELLALLVKGPVYVFGVAILAAIIAFGYSNRSSAPAGSGMSIDILAGSISAVFGLLAVTTNVIVSYLFSSREQDDTPKT